MKLFLLIVGDGPRVDALGQIVSSRGMILHRDSVPLRIETDELYSAALDKNDLREVARLWARARELVAEINGAAMFEFKDWPPISLNNMEYVNKNGAVEWMPNTASLRATLSALVSRTLTAAEAFKLSRIGWAMQFTAT